MRRAIATAAIGMLVLAACSKTSTPSDSNPPPENPGPAPITIQATEFQFIMPDTIPAGVQTLHIENIGGMPHFMEFQSVAGGHTDADIQAILDDPKALKANQPPPSWISPAPMPGIDLLSPGTSADITVDLPPGTYAAFCWMPDANGKPHAFSGMHHVFTVTGDDTGTLPTAEFTLTWNGTSIDGIPSTLAPGVHTIGLANSSGKKGEISIARALVDEPMDQLVNDADTWFKSLYAGAPPAEFLGGLASMPAVAGVQGTITLNFVDGVYGISAGGKGGVPVAMTVGAGGFPSPSATMSDMTCDPSGTALSVVASGVAFDRRCLAAPAGQAFTIAFDNKDASTSHNFAIYPEAAGAPALFTGDVVMGPATTTYDVPALDAGTYRFQCDVHPTTMNGTFIVA